MNRQKELALNTVILSVGKICTQFVNFLLLPLYTAMLTTSEYGIVDLFNTYTALLVPIFNWQFENGLFRFMLDFRENKERQKKIFSSVFFTNVVQVLIFLCIYFFVYNLWSSEYKIFLAIDVILTIFLNTMLQLPRGLGNNIVYAIGSFVSASLAVFFNVVFIAGFNMGAYGMFIALALSKTVTIIYLFIGEKAWRLLSVSHIDFSELKEICKYSFPLIPNTLSWWIVGASDRTIISKVIGVGANGVYSVANKFSTVFITIYNMFNLSWTESVSLHIKDSDAREFLSETINMMFKLFSSICILMIACMPIVFPYFVDESYSEAYQQIPILMIAVLFQVVVGLYSVIYVAEKKSGEIAKTSFYAALINVVVNLVLIKKIGLYAASISTLVAYATMAIYRYFHVKKYMDVPLKFNSVMVTVIETILVVVTYYVNNGIINYIVLLLVTVSSVFYNYDFCKALVREIRNLINKR